MKYLASLLLLLALAVPCLAQAPAPRYPVSANHVTNLKQAGAMLQEFAGGYGLAAINAKNGLGLSGKLEVSNKIDFVFDKTYAGQGSTEVIPVPQVFVFNYILVGQDTVNSGGLFYAEFSYRNPDNGNIVTLSLRFYPSKRCVGTATIINSKGADLGGFVIFLAPVSNDGEFLDFLSQAAQVFIDSLTASDPTATVTAWANGTWKNSEEH